MKRMDFTACVLMALSLLTATLRWMSVAAAHASMARAGTTLMGIYIQQLFLNFKVIQMGT